MRISFSRSVRLRAVYGAAVSALVACAGGGTGIVPQPPRAAASANPSPAAPSPSAAPEASSTPQAGPAVDDWTTFAHDQARTGFQKQLTGIDAANVATLTKRWSVSLGESLKASPLVAGGMVYVAGRNGTIRALSSATGATIWQASIGSDVQMTPELADGLLFVGTHGTPSEFAAFDAATGTLRWNVTIPGAIRAEPVVVNGTVYIGDASGDEPFCVQGGIYAFDELSGSPSLVWFDDPTPSDGGAVWSAISTDGDALYFGTGNTCSPNVSNANAAVKLTFAGAVDWVHNEANPLSDDDFGSGLLLMGNDAFGSDKNGTIFDFDRSSGSVVWSRQIGLLDGYGPIGSPASDGATIVADGGYVNDPTKTPVDPGGLLYALDAATGHVLWRIETQDEVRGNTPINAGVVYASMNDGLFALDEKSGATLWSYGFGNDTYASPAIVPSGIYDADDAGNIYAFGLPSQSAASRRRAGGGPRLR